MASSLLSLGLQAAHFLDGIFRLLFTSEWTVGEEFGFALFPRSGFLLSNVLQCSFVVVPEDVSGTFW